MEFIHPTTGKPPSASGGYDFFDKSLVTGTQHAAWDVGTIGFPIKNIKEGTCIGAGWHYQLGWHVYILCADGMLFVYAHMEKPPTVAAGQRIPQGYVLGYVGATGAAQGAHLHFAMSYVDVPTAMTKVQQYGGGVADVKWRTDLQRAFVNPAIFIDKAVGGLPTVPNVPTKPKRRREMWLYSLIDADKKGQCWLVGGTPVKREYINTMGKLSMVARTTGQIVSGSIQAEPAWYSEIQNIPVAAGTHNPNP